MLDTHFLIVYIEIVGYMYGEGILERMSGLRVQYEKKKDVILIIIGLLAVSMIVLPYFILGEGSYVEIHDQVDGEILNYIYQAKYLFAGDIIPEFMNGMAKASMLPPAPFGVLFYRVLSPFWAFVAMQWFVLLVGFVGMYFLCKKCGVHEEIGFLVAVLFAYMPFYPTYGLAALGQPLLVLCFWKMLESGKKLLPLLGVVLYAGFSSLTLIGYLWIVLGTLSVLYFLLVRKDKKKTGGVAVATGLLTLVYLATNLDLLRALLGKGFVTHREEFELTATANLWEKGKELLLDGGSYSKVYSLLILGMAALVIVLGCWELCGKKREGVFTKHLRHISLLLGTIFAGIAAAVLWNSEWIVAVRKQMGGIVESFQADRIYWTFPFLWMLLLAYVLSALYRAFGQYRKILPKLMAIVGIGLLLLGEGAQIFRDSTLNKNMRLVLLENYEQVTWEALYMEDTFGRIEQAIGEDKGGYSVVSLGLYPSVALYNGFTCADGYSNNYDLSYKHQFRRMMADELAEHEETGKYFDEWGNRLYLASSQYGMNAMIGKDAGLSYAELDYNTAAMKELNVKYLFAAAPIENAGELGMELLTGSPFCEETDYYAIWVYRIL